ncbi:MAG TPA: UDP-N-acetylglucosamine 1-carboxyvinyltransferase [Gemmatimonadaceae bacterium]|nr:UDP-N-acetylglucosamine 1-carboxyvinyltransferase [Gemmatimonadaceae bacterium]
MASVQYVVDGGRRLSGSIRPSGNKNAALPIIAAALLTEKPVTLHNVPRIRDTETLVELLRSVGAEAEWHGGNELRIHAHTVRTAELDAQLCARIRASILLAAPVLARCGEVVLPPPGGDVIGRRRVDTHFHVLERLGATVDARDQFSFRAAKLRGADIFLDEPSVTATENAMMAAAAAQGRTVLRNAASEPHVQDLAQFLCALGARIEGIGSNVMTIDGGMTLGGATHTIGPDHIEVGSFIGLAAVTRSPLRIEEAGVEHLRSTLIGFERLGLEIRVENNSLVIPGDQSPSIQSDLGGHVPTLADQPWPLFPADLMSIAIVTATQCAGLILMHEKMFESRLFFVDKLISMGARIVLCDPHRALVAGPTALRAARVSSPDIRAGMAMLLAALSANGRSIIEHAEQIERGYERIDERLNALGASITRNTDGA